jgi:hypothetical protein
MRIYEKDPRCWLAELSDLEVDPIPERVREHLGAIRTIIDWSRSYLAQPHPELGRSGPVCPFVRPALAKRTIFYSVWPGADLDPDEVESVARSFRDWFLELEPVHGRDAQYKSINIIFPDLPMSAVGELIDGTQERLKPLYARGGIMIGEFHPGPPQKAGLWNEDFRPLRCPLPMLSIRHLVPTDFAFLKDRREFMEAYLASVGDKVPGALAQAVHGAALRFGLRPGEEEASGAVPRVEDPSSVADDFGRIEEPRAADGDARVGEPGAARGDDRRTEEPRAADDGRAEMARAAAGCPHRAAEEARAAAAAAGCPHAAAAERAVREARRAADPGAGTGERVPVGRIVSEDTTGAGVRESTAPPPPIHTEETNR